MLPLKIAVRFLTAGKMQTILIVSGIALAVSAQIFVGLLITSLQTTIINRTIGHSPQITITSATDQVIIKDSRTILDNLSRTNSVKIVSISANGNALTDKNGKTNPILVRGFDLAEANKIYNFSGAVYEGNPNPTRNEVLIGRELNNELKYKIGDEIPLRRTDGVTGIYRIAGFFDLGIAQLNKTWVITTLETAQSFFDIGQRITSIELTLNDLFQADVVAAQLNTDLNSQNIKIENWKGQNRELLSGLQGQTISSLMIQIFIIISVVIAIASILAITVFQKSRQIGILKAMGIKDRAASLIFIYEGLLLGVAGSVPGVAFGLWLVYAFASFTTQPGQLPLIDLYLDYNFVITSWAIALAASGLAGLIPAKRSLSLNPADVIREG